MSNRNHRRISAAQTAINSYMQAMPDKRNEPDEAILIDFLTDLRHLAHDNNVDFASASSISLAHFHNENK